MRRPRFTWRRLTFLSAFVLAVVAAALWFTPSGQYLLLPDKAQLVEPLVAVESEREDAALDGNGIYMVDILVRKANVLEKLIPGLNDGATLIDAERLNPHGVSEQQRRQSSGLDMTRSQQIAAAVALESLDYEVEAVPSGAEVSIVLPDSPAAAAGLEPGDVIVGAGGAEVETLTDLREALDPLTPGDPVTLAILRDGKRSEYELVTQPSVDDPARAVVGVIVEQAATIELPVEISIDAGSIGGPSAGLAFALDIVDELGQDVDQGRVVVVTGELGLDGSVAAVGGVKQKVIGAMESGADVFVVPEGNAEEARRWADGGIEILAVETFDEALADLGATPVAS